MSSVVYFMFTCVKTPMLSAFGTLPPLESWTFAVLMPPRFHRLVRLPRAPYRKDYTEYKQRQIFLWAKAPEVWPAILGRQRAFCGDYVGPITCRRFSIDQSNASETHPHLSALPIHPSGLLSISHCTSQAGMFHPCLLSLFSSNRVSATASLYLQLVLRESCR